MNPSLPLCWAVEWAEGAPLTENFSDQESIQEQIASSKLQEELV